MNNLQIISNSKFKGIYISFNYLLDINKEQISEFALLTSILSKSSKKFKNQLEIEKHLLKLYGSSFDVNVQKLGDIYNIEFSMELVNKKFLPNNKDIFKECLEFLNEIVYHPVFENSDMDGKIFDIEKNNLLNIIRSRYDDKIHYAILNMEHMMSRNSLFGSYIYGDEEILSNIKVEHIPKIYSEFLAKSKLKILISGNLDGYDKIDEEIENVFGKNIENLKEKIEVNKCNIDDKYEEKIDKKDVNQSVIVYGLKIKDSRIEDYYKIMLYNSILGAIPSSKLFQKVREKNSLAYTVRSKYYRFKNFILIYAGIDKNNYELAKKVINEQIEEMKSNISIEEFNSAKESLLSDVKEWEDSKISIEKMQLSNILYLNSDNESLNQMYKNIEKVTLDDVFEVANKICISKIYFLQGGISNA